MEVLYVFFIVIHLQKITNSKTKRIEIEYIVEFDILKCVTSIFTNLMLNWKLSSRRHSRTSHIAFSQQMPVLHPCPSLHISNFNYLNCYIHTFHFVFNFLESYFIVVASITDLLPVYWMKFI